MTEQDPHPEPQPGQMSKVPYSEAAYKKNRKANKPPQRPRYMSNFSALVGILAFVLLFASYLKTSTELGAYGTGSLAGRLVGFLIIAWILFSIGKALRSRFIANALFCLVMFIPIVGYVAVLLGPSPVERTARDQQRLDDLKIQVQAETDAVLERGGTAEELTAAVIDPMLENLPAKDKPLFNVMRPVIEETFRLQAELKVLQESTPPTPWEDYETASGLREEAAFWREYERLNARVLANLLGLSQKLRRPLLEAGLTPEQADDKVRGFNRGYKLQMQVRIRESDARYSAAMVGATTFLADHFGNWGIDDEDDSYVFYDDTDFEPFNDLLKTIDEEAVLQEELFGQLTSP